MKVTSRTVLHTGLRVQFGVSYAPLILKFLDDEGGVLSGLKSITILQPQHSDTVRSVMSVKHVAEQIQEQLIETTSVLSRVNELLDNIVAQWGDEGHDERWAEFARLVTQCAQSDMVDLATSLGFEWDKCLTTISEAPLSLRSAYEKTIDNYGINEDMEMIKAHCLAYGALLDSLYQGVIE